MRRPPVILIAAAMVSVSIIAAALIVSMEEVCSRNYTKEQERFNRMVEEGAPFDVITRLEYDAPIYDCEWRWR